MGQMRVSQASSRTIRWALVALAAITAGTGGASAQATFGCGGSVPMYHAFDSYFECADALQAAAFAYQISAPESANTGTVDILRGLGDGKIQVHTDWGNPGI